uniref:Dienelactone hydrolase domain-containing protein n=1 Tax=Ditylum brightwellii TaxID=49249 RepID=A0A7S4WDC1_9STRA
MILLLQLTCCTPSAWELQQEDHESYSPSGIDTIVGSEKAPVYYIESLSASNKAIVIFPDIYGFSSRLRKIADTLAAKGFHVMLLDCFHGDTAEGKPDLLAWLTKFPHESILQDINAGLEFLLTKGVKEGEVSAIGFCWGGWAIAKSASEGISWKSGVSPHPSTKLEKFAFGMDEELMFSKVSMPFLLMPAGEDPDILKPGSSVVKKLEEAGGASVPFESMRHGWVSRGDLSIPDVKENIEKALAQMLEFIEKQY